MNAATHAVQRPADARLLVIGADGSLHHGPRDRLGDHFHDGDLLVANDAATLPASLAGVHLPTGAPIEIRLAGRRHPGPSAAPAFSAPAFSAPAFSPPAFEAIVFGAGDHRTPTERRAAPPPLHAGDRLTLGPLAARIGRTLGHPRLVALRFDGSADAVWAGIAAHGKPIQYAHLFAPLALWDVWTPIAAAPVAFEPPSAGFVLDWRLLDRLRERGVGFATLTHAAGISSTGDAELDARLPFDEPYTLPAATVAAIARAKRGGGRIVAVGTSVVRALEHAASADGLLRAGPGLATQRLGPGSHLRIVDALVSGTHEPGTSHHALLRAFVDAPVLARADAALSLGGYRTHEFGDSVLVEAAARARQRRPALAAA